MAASEQDFKELKDVVDTASKLVNPLLDGFQAAEDIGAIGSALLSIPQAVEGVERLDEALRDLSGAQQDEIDQLIVGNITTVEGAAYELLRPRITDFVLATAGLLLTVGVAKSQGLL